MRSSYCTHTVCETFERIDAVHCQPTVMYSLFVTSTSSLTRAITAKPIQVRKSRVHPPEIARRWTQWTTPTVLGLFCRSNPRRKRFSRPSAPHCIFQRRIHRRGIDMQVDHLHLTLENDIGRKEYYESAARPPSCLAHLGAGLWTMLQVEGAEVQHACRGQVVLIVPIPDGIGDSILPRLSLNFELRSGIFSSRGSST